MKWMMLDVITNINNVPFSGDVDDAPHGCIREHCLIFFFQVMWMMLHLDAYINNVPFSGEVGDAPHGCIREYCLIFR